MLSGRARKKPVWPEHSSPRTGCVWKGVWRLCSLPCCLACLIISISILLFYKTFMKSLVCPSARTVSLPHNGHFNPLHDATHCFSMSYLALSQPRQHHKQTANKQTNTGGNSPLRMVQEGCMSSHH